LYGHVQNKTEQEHSESLRIKCYRKEIYGATQTMMVKTLHRSEDIKQFLYVTY